MKIVSSSSRYTFNLTTRLTKIVEEEKKIRVIFRVSVTTFRPPVHFPIFREAKVRVAGSRPKGEVRV